LAVTRRKVANPKVALVEAEAPATKVAVAVVTAVGAVDTTGTVLEEEAVRMLAAMLPKSTVEATSNTMGTSISPGTLTLTQAAATM
jgi:hypothetical protein